MNALAYLLHPLTTASALVIISLWLFHEGVRVIQNDSIPLLDKIIPTMIKLSSGALLLIIGCLIIKDLWMH